MAEGGICIALIMLGNAGVRLETPITAIRVIPNIRCRFGSRINGLVPGASTGLYLSAISAEYINLILYLFLLKDPNNL
jgi:hypothetical protein